MFTCFELLIADVGAAPLFDACFFFFPHRKQLFVAASRPPRVGELPPFFFLAHSVNFLRVCVFSIS